MRPAAVKAESGSNTEPRTDDLKISVSLYVFPRGPVPRRERNRYTSNCSAVGEPKKNCLVIPESRPRAPSLALRVRPCKTRVAEVEDAYAVPPVAKKSQPEAAAVPGYYRKKRVNFSIEATRVGREEYRHSRNCSITPAKVSPPVEFVYIPSPAAATGCLRRNRSSLSLAAHGQARSRLREFVGRVRESTEETKARFEAWRRRRRVFLRSRQDYSSLGVNISSTSVEFAPTDVKARTMKAPTPKVSREAKAAEERSSKPKLYIGTELVTPPISTSTGLIKGR